MVEDVNILHYVKPVFPYSPSDFRVPRYTCNQKIGTVEEEEVAARIVHHCIREGCWCKIELHSFLSGINLEYIAITLDNNSRNDVLRRNRQSQAMYKENLLRYQLKVVLTFGIYHFFGNNRPVPPKLSNVPELNLPFTGAVNSMSHVQEGIASLTKKGAINIVTIKGNKWIVPTPKLLEPL